MRPHVIEIDTDPNASIGKGNVTFAAHELKHVKCWADALEWMAQDISTKVSSRCCCNYSEGVALMELIRVAAAYKAEACTLAVDATDYVRHDNVSEGKVKGQTAAQLEMALMRQLEKIDQAAKKWEKCK